MSSKRSSNSRGSQLSKQEQVASLSAFNNKFVLQDTSSEEMEEKCNERWKKMIDKTFDVQEDAIIQLVNKKLETLLQGK